MTIAWAAPGGLACLAAVALLAQPLAEAQTSFAAGADMTYRLTADVLRKLLRVQPEVVKLAAGRASTASGDTPDLILDLERAASRLEADPEMRRILAAHQWSAVEFLQALHAAIQTVVAIDMLDAGQLNPAPVGALRANIDLWRNPPADLAADLKEWTQREMVPFLRALRD